MSKPYRPVEDGDLIRAEDWNEIQSIIKEEVRTHRHGGGGEGERDPAKLGGLLQSKSLADAAITMEKIEEDAVSARVLAHGAIGPEHFRPEAAIDESKILFDPDEPVAFALAEVTLRAPDEVANGGDFLWAIPAGTPITNQAGDLVFRTMDPVSLSFGTPEIQVAVRCEQPGVHGNVPAGTLTRVGGALDPFLRGHVSISQQEPAEGGLDPDTNRAPVAARAPVSFTISPHAPLTFWVIPKGTVVRQEIGVEDEYIEFVTRQSLSVFPGSGWAEAVATTTGEPGNIPAGSLELDDPALAARVAVDQPHAATGGALGAAASVALRFRLLGPTPSTPFVVPANTRLKTEGGQVVFETADNLTLHAGGSEPILADPAEASQPALTTGQPLTIAPDIRPRLDKIYDPMLVRYIDANLDESFTPDASEPDAIRLIFTVSERAPHVAWRILAGARFSVTPASAEEQDALDNTEPLPLFQSTADLTLFGRSAWVWADAEVSGSDSVLPAGELSVIEDLPSPLSSALLEVDQPMDGFLSESGYAQVLVRFRILEGVALDPNTNGWEVPEDTIISDGDGTRFRTRDDLFISPGGMGKVDARSELPGVQGNLVAETLNRVLPETEVRNGNVIDRETVTPYLSVLQPDNATGGGPMLARARALLDISVSERAPRTTWLIPRDTRLLRPGGQSPEFETIDPLAVLPRTGWVWATPEDPTDEGDIPAEVLTQAIGLTTETEVWQPDAADMINGAARVRVWFRITADAVPPTDNTWRIPAGTVVADKEGGIRFVTASELELSFGGTAIAMTDANKTGASVNGIDDLHELANPEDFESLLLVTQAEPAEGGADGGSDGHHHKVEPGALPSHPLADQSISAEQIAEDAVTWPKLSDRLAERLMAIRDSLKAVEDALLEASAMESLMKQQHRSASQ